MSVQIGTQGKGSVKITNTGAADLHESAIKISGAMAALFSETTTVPITIAATQSSSFDVTFTPTMAGAAMATLEVDSSDPSVTPAMITLQGSGVSPQVSASPTKIDFGPIPIGDSSVAQAVTVTNGGKKAVVLDKIVCANSAYGPPASGLGMSIDPGMSVTLMVTFAPTMVGDQNASLEFWLQ